MNKKFDEKTVEFLMCCVEPIIRDSRMLTKEKIRKIEGILKGSITLIDNMNNPNI